MAQISGSFKEAAELQLMELEMLKSMYPGPKEVEVETPGAVLERRALCQEALTSSSHYPEEFLSSYLDININFMVDAVKFLLLVSLPPMYPFARCDVSLQCLDEHFNKQANARLNSKLKSFLSEQPEGELVVGTLLSWLQENCEQQEIIARECVDKTSSNTSESNSKKDIFSRMWVYSHHIHSKVKRKDLIDLSVEYDLTGFLLPGKPGLICVEGTQANVDSWWSLIRNWTWKKILCKRQENLNVSTNQALDSYRRFKDFRELCSRDVRVKGGGFHVDMGDVFTFLKRHNSEYMFKEYFGVDGK